ncbi:hypothetical protein RsoM2USA_168 [Ralstonia phage RsoM2USA]|nr:hypothetical protein RsoM2USA_168 [Ralstonia phage RsoM2USA]
MVRVVSTTPPEDVVKRIVHRHCGATLEYLPIDVQTHRSRDYSGGTDVTEYIVCPHCRQEVVIRSY